MDIINKKVQHSIFGNGKICEVKDKTIMVQFSSTIKKFVFPDAFREHLVISEKKIKKDIEIILAEIDRDKQERQELEALESEKRRLLRSLPLNENAQAAFGCVCNDEQTVVSNWCALTGKYQSGNKRGQPHIPLRVYPNSACLFTHCEKGEPEEVRRIWGVFMAGDDFVGPECTDGKIPAHDEYRIVLTEKERQNLLFWQYFAPDSQKTKWGSGEFKYISNMKMALILRDISLLKRGTDQQKLCEDFLEYYCDLNKISSNLLMEQGAII